jgi:hypothetical protein
MVEQITLCSKIKLPHRLQKKQPIQREQKEQTATILVISLKGCGNAAHLESMWRPHAKDILPELEESSSTGSNMLVKIRTKMKHMHNKRTNARSKSLPKW